MKGIQEKNPKTAKFIYGIEPETVTTEEDVYYAADLIKEHFGRELIVRRPEFNEITGFLTTQEVIKTICEEKKSRIGKIYFLKKSFFAYESSLTIKKIIEAARKCRSLYIMNDGYNPKGKLVRSLKAEIMTGNMLEFFTGTHYSENNCPYSFRFKVMP
jgi:hypothetical protein